MQSNQSEGRRAAAQSAANEGSSSDEQEDQVRYIGTLHTCNKRELKGPSHMTFSMPSDLSVALYYVFCYS